jgi:protein-S-isoprenylcysteine O-methyltransferase Ste14
MDKTAPSDTSHGTVDNTRNARNRMRYIRLLAIALIASLPFLQSVWSVAGPVHETLEIVGVAFLIVCICGRVWCSAYIGGRKNYELVKDGPFSIVRNPLYVFSFIGVTGIGLLTGMVTVTIFAQVVFVLFHHATILREESVLREAYGAAYQAYLDAVPRWVPRLSLWQEPDEIQVRPRFLYLTLRDIAWIVLLFPFVEAIDALQVAGHLPVLLYLP